MKYNKNRYDHKYYPGDFLRKTIAPPFRFKHIFYNRTREYINHMRSISRYSHDFRYIFMMQNSYKPQNMRIFRVKKKPNNLAFSNIMNYYSSPINNSCMAYSKLNIFSEDDI